MRINGHLLTKSVLKKLSHCLKRTEASVIANLVFTDKEFQKIKRKENKLFSNYPVEYLIGQCDFYKYKFYIQRGVFIPRPETENIVEFVLDWLKSKKIDSAKILDLCSGSGCVGITILLECLRQGIRASLTLVDKSKKAIATCLKNTKLHKINAAVIQSDLFKHVKGKFTVIVFNPPYLMPNEITGSLQYEPRRALVGSKDGITLYKSFFENLPSFVEDDFLTVMETSEALVPKLITLGQKLKLNLRLIKTESKVAFLAVSSV
ncbi:MAG: HemK family protein methyltransferase [Deltaproteobacteria bacterium]|nr:HemK family protein methyltransferase [Deltaproteobacteria bacterium]